ncbi:MAG: DUF817 domain-containing protein [Parvibaculaceae bacterium]
MRANTRFTAIRLRLEALEFKSRWAAGVYEFLLFGFKQGWACLFGGLLLALLLLTHLFYPRQAPLARYDFLVIACIGLQAGMLAAKLETWEEARVILLFHIVGTIMEIFKTAMGSWIYPEESLLRIGGVPLFSGFMYAAVGSYLARVWRIFDFRFTRHPPLWATALLAAGIYINFFTHHYVADVRWLLIAAAVAMFGRTIVWFTPWREPRPMPLVLGFLLVATFIWLAENLGTFARAWVYRHQAGAWTPVMPEKLTAWFLLMLISYVLVSLVHRPQAFTRRPATLPEPASP